MSQTRLTPATALVAKTAILDMLKAFPAGATNAPAGPGSKCSISLFNGDELTVDGYVTIGAADDYMENNDYFTFRDTLHRKMVFSRRVINEEDVQEMKDAILDLMCTQYSHTLRRDWITRA